MAKNAVARKVFVFYREGELIVQVDESVRARLVEVALFFGITMEELLKNIVSECGARNFNEDNIVKFLDGLQS